MTDGRQVRWQRHNADRRAHVLEAALRVIEEGGGADLHVQQIAEAAGLSRTVLYRHFEDRADLDDAIQTEILRRLGEHVAAAAVVAGSLSDLLTRVVAAYVAWADEHPALHRVAERDRVDGTHRVAELAGQLTTTITGLVVTVSDLLGAERTEVEEQALPLLAHGVLGLVHGTVHEWLRRDPRQPSAADLTALLGESLLHMISGHLQRKGIAIGPDDPLPGQSA